MRTLTEKQFLEDVKDHEMQILLDNGVYRHLRFKSTGKYPWNQWFDVVTWPGYLAYSGDMGCFVFSRLNDMFEFFRTRPSDEKAQLHINTGYWAEKLEAVDRDHLNNSEKAFSEEKFRERVEEYVKDWTEDHALHLQDDDLSTLRDSIEDEVLRRTDDGEYEARRALNDFTFESESGETLQFQDTWEWDLREYTVRFVWCCYALAWSIQKYDLSIKQTEESNVPV